NFPTPRNNFQGAMENNFPTPGEKKVKDNNTVLNTTVNNTTTNIENDQVKKGNEGKGPYQQIENYYESKVKRRCSGKDLTDIFKTYQRYKDLDFIFKTIDMVVERNIETHGKLTIKSFSYFEQIFEEEWEKLKLREKHKEVAIDEPASRNSNGNIEFDKSKFLYNGD